MQNYVRINVITDINYRYDNTVIIIYVHKAYNIHGENPHRFGFVVSFLPFQSKTRKKNKQNFFPPYSRNMLCHFIVMENFRGTKVEVMQNLDELIFR